MEFKTVNEVYVPCEVQTQKLRLLPRSWDEKEYKYKVVESTTPSGEVDELDEYIFVLRVRIGKYVDLLHSSSLLTMSHPRQEDHGRDLLR